MSRFASSSGIQPARARTMRASSPAQTTGPALTHERGTGAALDDKSALFQIGVTSMLGGGFYEQAEDTLARLVELTRTVTTADPDWIRKFIPWCRTQGLMRTAPVVMAVEAAAQMVADGVPGGRQLLWRTCRHRADEPIEAVAYWIATRGSKAHMPAALKRGVADALNIVVNEYTAAKYDSGRNAVRMADVLRIVHPHPQDDHQSALYRWLIARRDGKGELEYDLLPQLGARQELLDVPVADRRKHLSSLDVGDLRDAGITWEFLAGWLSDGGGMTGEAWTKALPSMGYMARLRNIRNMEAAGVPELVLDQLAAYLAEPSNVAHSRQFPFAFWTAYRATKSLRFAHPLEKAAEAACANVPALTGRSLVLVDISGSMQVPYFPPGRQDGSSAGFRARFSHRGGEAVGRPLMWEVGAFFAAALAKANKGNCDLTVFGTNAALMGPQPTILQAIEQVLNITRHDNQLRNPQGQVMDIGHGTNTWQAANAMFARGSYDRTFVFSDQQAHPGSPEPAVANKPIYLFNVGANATTALDLGRGVHQIGGFTDAAFRLPTLVEQGTNISWDDLFTERSSTGIIENEEADG